MTGASGLGLVIMTAALSGMTLLMLMMVAVSSMERRRRIRAEDRAESAQAAEAATAERLRSVLAEYQAQAERRPTDLDTLRAFFDRCDHAAILWHFADQPHGSFSSVFRGSIPLVREMVESAPELLRQVVEEQGKSRNPGDTP